MVKRVVEEAGKGDPFRGKAQRYRRSSRKSERQQATVATHFLRPDF
jgi:hypothetical protein